MRVALGKRFQAVLYGTVFVLWSTGSAWLLIRYLLSTTPTPLWLKIHGAAAILFEILFGALAFHHVRLGWRQKVQRPSGASVITVFALLIVTGWGLYYFGNETLRQWTSVLHSALGVAVPALLFFHAWFAKRRLARPPKAHHPQIL